MDVRMESRSETPAQFGPHPLAAAGRRSVAVALTVAALVVGAASGARAQAAPSPAPSASPAAPAGAPTAPGTNGGSPTNSGPTNPTGGQPSVPRPAATPLGHLPIIDITTVYTQPGVYGPNMPGTPAQVHNQAKIYDPLDVGGTVKIPITSTTSASFDRLVEGTLNQPLERVLYNGEPVFAGDTRDVILQYRIDQQIKRFTVEAGLSFRHRLFAEPAITGANTSGVSNVPFPYSNSSSEHHYGYLGVTYTTPPIPGFLHSSFAFSETGDAQNVDHHVGTLCSAAAAKEGICATPGTIYYVDENPGKQRYYESTQGVTWIVPVDIRHGTSFTLNDRWGALNFYENAPFPYLWNSALTYQLNKRFSPGFTLSLRHSDYHAEEQGAPFLYPNAIHVASWDVIGTFHLDLNTLFR